jgi:hypothetical protein
LVVDLAAFARLVVCYFVEDQVFGAPFHSVEERVLEALDSADVEEEVVAFSPEGAWEASTDNSVPEPGVALVLHLAHRSVSGVQSA